MLAEIAVSDSKAFTEIAENCKKSINLNILKGDLEISLFFIVDIIEILEKTML